MAKIIGEQWQGRRPETRERCEQEAGAAWEKYYAELSEYKKTEEYAEYQSYLAEFKAKHRPKMTDAEQSKHDQGTNFLSSNSHPQCGPKETQIPRRC